VGDRVAFGIMPIDDPAVSAAEPGQTHAKSQTLTRSELYALVWSKPVCDVAEDFGVSGFQIVVAWHFVAFAAFFVQPDPQAGIASRLSCSRISTAGP